MLAVPGQIFQSMGNNSLNGISSSDPTGQTNLDQLLAELNSILQELANDVAVKSGEGPCMFCLHGAERENCSLPGLSQYCAVA